ncbi:MAG: hypothetical protein LBL21_03040 [Rickettsiales bacterium]|jgi:hypothetical protein|nr:hypothetical protein [Rickettsiales bacterium]
MIKLIADRFAKIKDKNKVLALYALLAISGAAHPAVGHPQEACDYDTVCGKVVSVHIPEFDRNGIPIEYAFKIFGIDLDTDGDVDIQSVYHIYEPEYRFVRNGSTIEMEVPSGTEPEMSVIVPHEHLQPMSGNMKSICVFGLFGYLPGVITKVDDHRFPAEMPRLSAEEEASMREQFIKYAKIYNSKTKLEFAKRFKEARRRKADDYNYMEWPGNER